MRAHAHEDGRACPARLAASEETPGRAGQQGIPANNGDRPSARPSYWLPLLRLPARHLQRRIVRADTAVRRAHTRRLLIHLSDVLLML